MADLDAIRARHTRRRSETPLAVAIDMDTLLADAYARRAADGAVGDLLAVLLGDGGHRQAEVGTEQAASEALERVHALHQRVAEAPRSLMAEAVDCELLRHVPVRSDRDLLTRAIKSAGHDGPRRVRWAAVSDLLGHGSGVSYALCLAAGLDPDEMVGAEPDEVDDVDDE